MVSLRGKFETDQLRRNIKLQMNRLLMQMDDLTKFRDEFDTEEEWLEEKRETEQQLKEFQEFLNRTISGDMTLIDEFSSVQLAIQNTISNAFQTPDIIRMFAAKEPKRLRTKLEQLERDAKISHKIKKKKFIQQKYEILLALQKLHSKLTADEQGFIKAYEQRGLTGARAMGSTIEHTLTNAKTQIATAGN